MDDRFGASILLVSHRVMRFAVGLFTRSFPSVFYFGNELQSEMRQSWLLVFRARGSMVEPECDQRLELAQQINTLRIDP
jgi:hypothetical protein